MQLADDGRPAPAADGADLMALPGQAQGPWRKVLEARYHSGQITFVRHVYGHWWDLVLDCGHQEERTCRFPPGQERGWARLHHGPKGEPLAAPRRVRCSYCRTAGPVTEEELRRRMDQAKLAVIADQPGARDDLRVIELVLAHREELAADG